MFLGLRKADGVSTTLFHEKFGQSLDQCLRRNNSIPNQIRDYSNEMVTESNSHETVFLEGTKYFNNF